MFLKLMLRIVEVLINVLVSISQVAALNWSVTIYPNVGYSRQKHRNRHFWHEKSSAYTLCISDVPETYVENSWGPKQRFGVNQPSGRAQLKWHHIPKLKLTRQKRRKSTFWIEKWSENILDISDVPETYVENSWGPLQRFGINQPSGRAQLKWYHIAKLRVTPSKTTKIDISDTKSHLLVLYALVMFLKLMLRIVEVLTNVLVLISQVAALNWSDTIYPDLSSKTTKIDILNWKVIWKYFRH